VRLNVTLGKSDELAVKFQGKTIASLSFAELENGRGALQILIDKGVAEIFVDGGARYIVRELPTTAGTGDLQLGFAKTESTVNQLEVYQMKSMWGAHETRQR
jgi:sucrose-6-phosphate hydrolase SacC (GH32 family)